MSLRLNQIQNWPELAQRANWSVTALAKQCGVSTDTLRRYFLNNMQQNPKSWMAEQRLRQAVKLLRDGSSIKEVAANLGYKQQTNFTRQFKTYWGTCPSLPGGVNSFRALSA